MATSNENPSKIILAAVALLGIAAGYIIYSTSLKEDAAIPPPAAVQTDSLSKFKNLDLDFSVFDDARFKSFKIFGESPVQPGPTGRTDIFAPY